MKKKKENEIKQLQAVIDKKSLKFKAERLMEMSAGIFENMRFTRESAETKDKYKTTNTNKLMKMEQVPGHFWINDVENDKISADVAFGAVSETIKKDRMLASSKNK